MTTFITTLLDVTGMLLLVAILWELRTMPRVRVEVRRITPKKHDPTCNFQVNDAEGALKAFRREMNRHDRKDGLR